jgi:broad specificity phosphatase PhoE
MATELILIRHGNTIPVNGDYVHAPLTALGQQQAEQTGQYLAQQARPGGFYASPLRRAKETAEIIGKNISMTPEIKNGIQEVEGLEVPMLAVVEVLSIFDPIEDYLDDHAGKAINWPIQGRVAKAILEMAAAHPDQQVITVAHSGVISSALAWAFPEQRLHWWLTTVKNCSLTRLRINGAQIELLAVNDTHHLAPVETTAQQPTKAVEATKAVMQTVKPTKT